MNENTDWNQRLGRMDFGTVIERCGGEAASLTTHERWDRIQQWREVFAIWLHAATGSWKFRGYEWHVFSYEYAQSLNVLHAAEEYLSQQPKEFFVIPEDERFEAFRISGGRLPDLRSVMNDIVVSPTDFEWTMAFTHEESIGLGPYFSRREWLAEPPPRKTKRRRS